MERKKAEKTEDNETSQNNKFRTLLFIMGLFALCLACGAVPPEGDESNLEDKSIKATIPATTEPAAIVEHLLQLLKNRIS